MTAEGRSLPDLSERVALLAREIEAGKAWGSVLLPLEHGDTCGATLNEAEEALCVVVDRLRAQNAKLGEDYADLEEALDTEMARGRRDRAENERLEVENVDSDDAATMAGDEIERIKSMCAAHQRDVARMHAENERLREAVLAAYNALTQVDVDHRRAHNVKHTAWAMDVLRAELRGSTWRGDPVTDHCACCTLLAVPEVVGPKCLEDGEVYCADCAFAKTSEELGRLRAENERLREALIGAREFILHNAASDARLTMIDAVLAGTSDERKAP